MIFRNKTLEKLQNEKQNSTYLVHLNTMLARWWLNQPIWKICSSNTMFHATRHGNPTHCQAHLEVPLPRTKTSPWNPTKMETFSKHQFRSRGNSSSFQYAHFKPNSILAIHFLCMCAWRKGFEHKIAPEKWWLTERLLSFWSGPFLWDMLGFGGIIILVVIITGRGPTQGKIHPMKLTVHLWK